MKLSFAAFAFVLAAVAAGSPVRYVSILKRADGSLYAQHSTLDAPTVSIGAGKDGVKAAAERHFAQDRLGATPFAANEPARASYHDTIESNGWSFLNIETNPAYDDTTQAEAAGYAEGLLTIDNLINFYKNSLTGFCDGANAKFCMQLGDWMAQNEQFVAEEKQKEPNSPYWYQYDLLNKQATGLYQGLNDASPGTFTPWDVFLLNAGNDIGDIQQAIAPGVGKKLRETNDGCSALVKWVKGVELYASQVTWSEFNSMIRIYKRYAFNYRAGPNSSSFMPGRVMTFSSYPGTLTSGDDFYEIHESGLVTMETTLGVNNQTLYDLYVKPSCVLEWQRSMIANRLAESGQDWVDIFSNFNSGTYNNQWMVVDYDMFTASQSRLLPGTLWVLEQVPGFINSADMTSLLEQQQYWPSYNTPYFPFIFDISGQPLLVKQYGSWFSYNETARALIFARDHVKVVNDKTMMNIMRYNKFQTDPLSKCACTPLGASGENAIAARSDLNPANGTYPFSALSRRAHGALDAKVTSSAMFAAKKRWIISGPTAVNQPPFDWTTADFPGISHEGMPDRWTFDWQLNQFPDTPSAQPEILSTRPE